MLFAIALGLLAPAAVSATAGADTGHDCFASTQWRGWSAPGNSNILLLRVGINDVYRVELTPGTRVFRAGDRFLVNQSRGSTWVCAPIDLDLTLNDPHGGIVQPLIATGLRKLTAAEVEAIPAHDRPS
jgi:hypothetical protein